MKHNKKRNTAFIYEALVRELSKSVIRSDTARRNKITEVFRHCFKADKLLALELECYRVLSEGLALDKYNAEKMVYRAKHQHSKIDQKKLSEEKNQMIKKIHQSLGSQIFSNFVPNYKTYATISQIFNQKTPLGKKVLMENRIVSLLTTSSPTHTTPMIPVDNLVVNSFSKRFNEKYVGFLPEQKTLLSKFIVSFGANDADFRVYLVTELQRLHSEVKKSLNLGEVRDDPEMLQNTKSVLDIIENTKVSLVDAPQLKRILKLQSLVREYQTDAS